MNSLPFFELGAAVVPCVSPFPKVSGLRLDRLFLVNVRSVQSLTLLLLCILLVPSGYAQPPLNNNNIYTSSRIGNPNSPRSSIYYGSIPNSLSGSPVPSLRNLFEIEAQFDSPTSPLEFNFFNRQGYAPRIHDEEYLSSSDELNDLSLTSNHAIPTRQIPSLNSNLQHFSAFPDFRFYANGGPIIPPMNGLMHDAHGIDADRIRDFEESSEDPYPPLNHGWFPPEAPSDLVAELHEDDYHEEEFSEDSGYDPLNAPYLHGGPMSDEDFDRFSDSTIASDHSLLDFPSVVIGVYPDEVTFVSNPYIAVLIFCMVMYMGNPILSGPYAFYQLINGANCAHTASVHPIIPSTAYNLCLSSFIPIIVLLLCSIIIAVCVYRHCIRPLFLLFFLSCCIINITAMLVFIPSFFSIMYLYMCCYYVPVNYVCGKHWTKRDSMIICLWYHLSPEQRTKLIKMNGKQSMMRFNYNPPKKSPTIPSAKVESPERKSYSEDKAKKIDLLHGDNAIIEPKIDGKNYIYYTTRAWDAHNMYQYANIMDKDQKHEMPVGNQKPLIAYYRPYPDEILPLRKDLEPSIRVMSNDPRGIQCAKYAILARYANLNNEFALMDNLLETYDATFTTREITQDIDAAINILWKEYLPTMFTQYDIDSVHQAAFKNNMTDPLSMSLFMHFVALAKQSVCFITSGKDGPKSISFTPHSTSHLPKVYKSEFLDGTTEDSDYFLIFNKKSACGHAVVEATLMHSVNDEELPEQIKSSIPNVYHTVFPNRTVGSGLDHVRSNLVVFRQTYGQPSEDCDNEITRLAEDIYLLKKAQISFLYLDYNTMDLFPIVTEDCRHGKKFYAFYRCNNETRMVNTDFRLSKELADNLILASIVSDPTDYYPEDLKEYYASLDLGNFHIPVENWNQLCQCGLDAKDIKEKAERHAALLIKNLRHEDKRDELQRTASSPSIDILQKAVPLEKKVSFATPQPEETKEDFSADNETEKAYVDYVSKKNIDDAHDEEEDDIPAKKRIIEDEEDDPFGPNAPLTEREQQDPKIRRDVEAAKSRLGKAETYIENCRLKGISPHQSDPSIKQTNSKEGSSIDWVDPYTIPESREPDDPAPDCLFFELSESGIITNIDLRYKLSPWDWSRFVSLLGGTTHILTKITNGERPIPSPFYLPALFRFLMFARCCTRLGFVPECAPIGFNIELPSSTCAAFLSFSEEYDPNVYKGDHAYSGYQPVKTITGIRTITSNVNIPVFRSGGDRLSLCQGLFLVSRTYQGPAEVPTQINELGNEDIKCHLMTFFRTEATKVSIIAQLISRSVSYAKVKYFNAKDYLPYEYEITYVTTLAIKTYSEYLIELARTTAGTRVMSPEWITFSYWHGHEHYLLLDFNVEEKYANTILKHYTDVLYPTPYSAYIRLCRNSSTIYNILQIPLFTVISNCFKFKYMPGIFFSSMPDSYANYMRQSILSHILSEYIPASARTFILNKATTDDLKCFQPHITAPQLDFLLANRYFPKINFPVFVTPSPPKDYNIYLILVLIIGLVRCIMLIGYGLLYLLQGAYISIIHIGIFSCCTGILAGGIIILIPRSTVHTPRGILNLHSGMSLTITLFYNFVERVDVVAGYTLAMIESLKINSHYCNGMIIYIYSSCSLAVAYLMNLWNLGITENSLSWMELYHAFTFYNEFLYQNITLYISDLNVFTVIFVLLICSQFQRHATRFLIFIMYLLLLMIAIHESWNQDFINKYSYVVHGYFDAIRCLLVEETIIAPTLTPTKVFVSFFSTYLACGSFFSILLICFRRRLGAILSRISGFFTMAHYLSEVFFFTYLYIFAASIMTVGEALYISWICLPFVVLITYRLKSHPQIVAFYVHIVLLTLRGLTTAIFYMVQHEIVIIILGLVCCLSYNVIKATLLEKFHDQGIGSNSNTHEQPWPQKNIAPYEEEKCNDSASSDSDLLTPEQEAIERLMLRQRNCLKPGQKNIFDRELSDEPKHIFDLLGEVDITDLNYESITPPNRTILKLNCFTKEGTKMQGTIEEKFLQLKMYCQNRICTGIDKTVRTGYKMLTTVGSASAKAMGLCDRNLFSGIFFRHTASSNIENPLLARAYKRKIKKIVKRLAKKMEDWFELNPIIDEDDYIASQPSISKQKAVAKGFQNFRDTQKIDPTLQVMMKTHEYHFEHIGDMKPRVVWCPSQTLRSVGGLYAKNLINIMKHTIPGFTHGLDTEKLEEKMKESLSKVVDPISGDWDGKMHDSNQHSWWIRAVDIELHAIMIPIIAARLGWSDNQIRELKKITMTTEFPFIAYYTKTRIPMCTGILDGTVFSGHPTLTTVGNTFRICTLIIFLQEECGIPENGLSFHVAGDDVHFFISRQYKSIWEHTLFKYCSMKDGLHGIGYQLKKMCWRGNVIDFLSKTGCVTESNDIVLHRYVHRAILSGNVTHKIKKGFGKEEHRWAITSQLKSWCTGFTFIQQYVDERFLQLKHKMPKRLTDLLWNDPEQTYKLVSNSNSAADKSRYEQLIPYLFSSAYEYCPNYTNSALTHQVLADQDIFYKQVTGE